MWNSQTSLLFDSSLGISHVGTVVPECFEDDNASQWKSGKFDPRSLKNPWTDRHLNLHGWLRRGPLPLCKISSRYDYPLCPPNMRKCASSDSAIVFLVLPTAYSKDSCTDFHDQYIKWRSFAQGCAFWGSRKQNFTFRPLTIKSDYLLTDKTCWRRRPVWVFWLCCTWSCTLSWWEEHSVQTIGKTVLFPGIRGSSGTLSLPHKRFLYNTMRCILTINMRGSRLHRKSVTRMAEKFTSGLLNQS